MARGCVVVHRWQRARQLPSARAGTQRSRAPSNRQGATMQLFKQSVVEDQAASAATDAMQVAPAALALSLDAELAARAARGDAQAFAIIMRRHNRLLFRTARSVLKDDSEAEDAL